MRWYHWVAMPFVVLVLVLAFIAGRRDRDLSETIKAEFDSIEAKATAKRMKAALGADQARRWVETRYATKIEQLSKTGRAKANALRDDPVALAGWLSSICR